MPIRVEAPDGSIAEFPDGMTDEQISAVMQREYGGKDERPKSFTLGVRKGVGHVIDNVATALETGAGAVGLDKPINAVGEALGMPTTAEAKAQGRNFFAEQAERPSPVGELTGKIAASIPAAAVTRNPWIAGGIAGAVTTDESTPGGVAFDAGVGAVTGGVADKVIRGVSGLVAPVVTPAVKRLTDAGVKLTPGLRRGGAALKREDLKMSKPFVGEAIQAGREGAQNTWNVATVNEALAPIGVKAPSVMKPGHEMVDWAHQQVGRQYDLIVPNLNVAMDGKAFASAVKPFADALEPSQLASYQKFLNTYLKSGKLSGQELKTAQGELRRLAAKYSRDPSAPNNALGDALWAADDELTAAMIAQNPRYAADLQKANDAYRSLVIIEDAASRTDDGVISTAQLRDAGRRADASKRKSATARGKAFGQDWRKDSREVIPNPFQNSGTADRSVNLFGRVGGAMDLGLYRANEVLDAFAALPRPPVAAKAAKTVERLKGPLSTAAVAAGNGRGE